MSERYPAGITSADHIAHDIRKGRFPNQSTVDEFLMEAATDEAARLAEVNRKLHRDLELVEENARRDINQIREAFRDDYGVLINELVEALESICAWKEPISLVAPELGGLLKTIYHGEAAIAKHRG